MESGTDITPISRDGKVRLAAYAGILCAYLAAVRNDPLTPFQLVFFALAASWSLGFEHRFRRPFFSPPIKIGLIALGAAIFVVFVAGNVGGTTEHFANSIARFLFWNAIVFVLSRNKSEYDLWTLAIIELSLFMISGSFVQPPFFVPLLLVSVTCLLYTFQRTAFLRCGPAGEQQKGGWAVMGLTLMLVLEAAALLFVAFPRGAFRSDKPPDLSKLDVPKPPPGEPVATGAERMGIPKNPQYLDLTSYEKLKADPRPVLRLRVRDLKDQPVSSELTLYLRGAILDTYEGGKWRTSFRKQDRFDAQDGKQDGWTELERNPPPGRLVVRQQIVTKGLAGDLSFALPDPLRVQLPRAKYDTAGTLFFAATPTDVIEYFVESALMPQDVPTLKRAPAPTALYLQLPPGLDLLRETARKQTEGLSAEHVHAKASRLLQYLRRNGFTYRLDPFVPAEGRDAVEHFLEKKAGYCTHFATALALMCRSVGVPARVATGFQLHDPGEDGSFLVRNSDAHAWVEVWFGPEHGWRSYDATPDHDPGAAPPAAGPDVASLDPKKPGEKEKGEAGRWDDFILGYDPKVQSESLGQALSAVVEAGGAAARFIASPPAALTVAGLLAAAALFYLLLPGSQRRRLRQVFAGFREHASIDFYRDFLWALSRRGIRKHPALTPREFAGQVRLTVKDDGIDFVTEKFYEAKYRGTPPTPEDRRRIDEIIQRLFRRPEKPSSTPA
jgi:transglutaminase-like putative cysteine protease